MATVLAAGLAAGIAAPPSLAGGMGAERPVDIPGQFYSPDTMPVLVGDTVTWTNHDHMTHTATSDDFDSGRLAPGAHFSFTFTKPGVYRYHCSIHRFMHGEVYVSAVALIGPLRSVPLGSTVSAQGVSSRDFDIGPSQMMTIANLARTVIGAQRDAFGDLRNMQVDVDVVGGSGKVLSFMEAIDNASGGITVRAE